MAGDIIRETEYQERGSGEHRWYVKIPGLARCHCGRTVELSDCMTNPCDCGRDLDGSGNVLAPRECWGEETGETAADIMLGGDRCWDE
jgi:hypothetical protein